MRIETSLLLAVAVFVAVPSLAVAAQYQCRSVDKDTRQIVIIVIEAHSKAEATYKANEHAAAAGEAARGKDAVLGKGGVNCRSAEELADVFLSDGWFKKNSQLRPYLPPDVKLSNTRAFECDPSGGFLPDNHPDSMTDRKSRRLNLPFPDLKYEIVDEGLQSHTWNKVSYPELLLKYLLKEKKQKT